MSIRLGVDFDNTIICYDGIFHRAGVERGLIPDSVGQSKGEVRDYLRGEDREDDWTELQGFVYGKKVNDCPPYPGVRRFFKAAISAGLDLFIVSHKTRHPYMGPRYDLHAAAREFIVEQGFHDLGLAEDRVFFELTKEAKMARIGALGCTHFIDDLPEFLAEPAFPKIAQRILFDPACRHAGEVRFARIGSWAELPASIGRPDLNLESGV